VVYLFSYWPSNHCNFRACLFNTLRIKSITPHVDLSIIFIFILLNYEGQRVTDTGRLANPGKHYFLGLIKEVVDEFNDGTWKVEQLSKELQKIVTENLQYFNVQNPGV